MNLLQRFYPESRFGGCSDRDGTVAFYGRIQGMLSSSMTVLDVGCGRGAGLVDDPVSWRRELRRLRGRCKRVIGIDVDPVESENPELDEFRHLRDPLAWPVDDAYVDVIVSDFVLHARHCATREPYRAAMIRSSKRCAVLRSSIRATAIAASGSS